MLTFVLMYKYLVICFAVVFFACKDKTPKPEVIDKQKMVEIMTDMSLAEGAMRVYHPQLDSSKAYSQSYYDAVCKKHKITYGQYDSSFRYYTGRPMELKEMMDEVLENLSKMESGIKK